MTWRPLLERWTISLRPSYKMYEEKQNLYLDKWYDFPEIENGVIKKGYYPHVRHRDRKSVSAIMRAQCHENIYVWLTLWILMRRTVDLPFNESNDRVETLKQTFCWQKLFWWVSYNIGTQKLSSNAGVHEFDDYLLLFAIPGFLSR